MWGWLKKLFTAEKATAEMGVVGHPLHVVSGPLPDTGGDERLTDLTIERIKASLVQMEDAGQTDTDIYREYQRQLLHFQRIKGE